MNSTKVVNYVYKCYENKHEYLNTMNNDKIKRITELAKPEHSNAKYFVIAETCLINI